MDVRFINPFINGIRHLFSTMLDTDVLIGKPRLKDGDEPSADISAIIGFSGDAAGSVALCFPTRTALAAAGKFAGVEMTRDHPDLGDALGELANMIAGQAKAKIDGFNISISLPRVVAGKELRMLDAHNTPVLVLPCDSSLGRFTTEVTMMLGTRRSGTTRATAAAAASA